MRWTPGALLALASVALADPEFTKPEAGGSIKGVSVQAEWKDSGDGVALTDLTTFDLSLCWGGNDVGEFECRSLSAKPVSFAGGKQFLATADAGWGAPEPKNAYFLKMYATASKGGTLTVYSPRFSMPDNTGTFTPTIEAALEKVTGTSGPAKVDAVADSPNDPARDEFDVEYTMQTGPTRYAPMQPIPPTKITKKKATPLHPTSAFSIATAFLPNPKIQTTITQKQTFSVQSRENTVAAAPMPTDTDKEEDDMAKFLKRWQD